jgi:predicted acyltransferase
MSKPERLASLDQFRGYTVVGMLLVNYFGNYKVCPQVLKHTHDYCSYADTIMPQFLFAVGFALRLSFGRRMQTQFSLIAYSRIVRRLLGLALISLVVYQVAPRAASWEQLQAMGFWNAISTPLKRDWFQTLMHIAVTSLWILPVVHCKPPVRVIWMLGSAIAHVMLSYWFNFDWVNSDPRGIDGGPLGFLTWTIPAIVGTLACDVFLQPRTQLQLGSPTLNWVLLASIFAMGLGYVISCGTRFYDAPDPLTEFSKSEKWAADPVWPNSSRLRSKIESANAAENGISSWLAELPFVKPPGKDKRQWNYWMMSQRSGTLAYLVFSAGFSLAVYLAFFVLSDLWGIQLSFFRTFGTNALIAYVLHMLVSEAVQSFFPKDAPAWFATIGLFLFFAIVWSIVRRLEKDGIFLKV